MAKDKAHQVDMRGLELLVDEVSLAVGGANLNLGVTAVDTADGSDPATTQALANALKVKLNQLIAALT